VNAPAKIKPARNRYAMIVKHHLPHCAPDELEARCSLLLVRDKAMSKARRCSDEARPMLEHIVRLVTEYAFRSIPLTELQELRYRITMLTACASGLEMFAYRLAHGGTDEGG
jgi:hypothetical protein